ncbi:antibiotic biosynthesis monooxygenase family protein [Spongiimicrobium sp. 2-473A-2-J]|uniref:antibiotic biosynthesis monooxygenase family protein n=1 Tax=Eudoraea algarum TaxID=3417568 RepID=UPI003D36FB94
MIIRIFRATVHKELHTEFMEKFREISIPLVKTQQGLVALEIGEPTQWHPNEFVMISTWETEQHIRNFVGDQWNEAHIPSGMEKYVVQCWVRHYRNVPL